ncbi:MULTISPECIES: hypothetical protein [Moraxella]|uniref:hypothetical protein n=1 Tax=Moraxella TaxID=475 RepID=UPI0012DEE10A|nr:MULTISPECIES: hypothetical protein [Moraxella]MBE9578486.1 hypothetical protein [Moraxella sp. K1664]MBE9587523.1 hypothetical protein [Moraxella sp. K1630]MBE9590143.1 hypothetical protein [Moraxella sp. K127]MBE9595982.1 hypothetical protein [Moraxella sp. K2450]MDH9217790.1 hypothetical protein [Moraxella lacunata]
MNPLTRIMQVVVATIGAIVIGFYFYQLYKSKQTDPYRQVNPYLGVLNFCIYNKRT